MTEGHRLPPRDLKGEHDALARVFKRHLEERFPGHRFEEVRPLEALKWGLSEAVPTTATAAWGARMIYPNDLVNDRQHAVGEKPDIERLLAWLNHGALRDARIQLYEDDKAGKLSPSNTDTFTVYEDHEGIVVASPRGSYGHVYVAAWLK